MERKPLFSVIIPVYKVELYIRQCIESVLQQSFFDYEVILVDDGSPDNCGTICDEYAMRNSRVHVLHKDNAGLSSARNTGLKVAEGEYIVFLDSDDMLEYKALEVFSKAINENRSDIYAGYPLCINEEDDSTYPRFERRVLKETVMPGIEFMELGLSQYSLEAPVQFNVYKREFLLENSLYFSEGILHEDERWMPEAFLYAKSVCEVDYTFYLYRIRANSITTSKEPKQKNAIDLIKTCNELESIVNRFQRRRVKWMHDRLARVYMSATFLGHLDLVKSVNLDRLFPIRNAYSLRSRMKAVLFAISPHMYCKIDTATKAKTEQKS